MHFKNNMQSCNKTSSSPPIIFINKISLLFSMSDIAEFILERGDQNVLDSYQQLLNHSIMYEKIREQMPEEREKMSGLRLGNIVDARIMERAHLTTQINYLMDAGWGNLPLVKLYYEQIMRTPFPEDYQGTKIPSQYLISEAFFQKELKEKLD